MKQKVLGNRWCTKYTAIATRRKEGEPALGWEQDYDIQMQLMTRVTTIEAPKSKATPSQDQEPASYTKVVGQSEVTTVVESEVVVYN